MKITSDFPGGNILVDKIDDNEVFLRPDLRDTEGEWFYWYFSVSNAAGLKVRFNFYGCRVFAAHGPAVSLDHGQSWSWLGADSVEGNSFTYSFRSGENSVRFCMTFPYLETHWNAFLKNLHDKHSLVNSRFLCTSRKGRPVETLLCGPEDAPRLIVVTARHHSCETMGSYALEGFISYLLSDQAEATQLRQQTRFLVVPFMDKDGVEEGDQGKNRRPRDHNRDYDDPHLYPETAALREVLAERKVWAALDFHCPWIAYGLNEKLYLVGSPDPRIWEQQQRFSEILERVQTGPLPIHASDNVPFGQEWNTAANFHQGKSFCTWVTEHANAQLACAIEVPYASANGIEVNPDSARAFGADLGRALAGYLK